MINYLKDCQRSTAIGKLPDIINHNNAAIKDEFNWLFDSSLNRLTKSVYAPTGSVKAHFGEYVNLSCEYLTVKNPESIIPSLRTYIIKVLGDDIKHNSLSNRFSDLLLESDLFAHDAGSIIYTAGLTLKDKIQELSQNTAYKGGTNITIDEDKYISANGYIYDNTLKSIVVGDAKNVSIGSYSTVIGHSLNASYGIKATGPGACAIGYIPATGIDRDTIASGLGSFAEGGGTIAGGQYSHAEGYKTEIDSAGESAHAEGKYNFASGVGAHVEGFDSSALGTGAHSEGYYTYASTVGTHAEGAYTNATYDAAHAEGIRTTASGRYSHAEGEYTTAAGRASHAEGFHTIASIDYQHVQGKYNKTDNNCAFIVGNGRAAYELDVLDPDKFTCDGWSKESGSDYLFATADDGLSTLQLLAGRYNEDSSILKEILLSTLTDDWTNFNVDYAINFDDCSSKIISFFTEGHGEYSLDFEDENFVGTKQVHLEFSCKKIVEQHSITVYILINNISIYLPELRLNALTVDWNGNVNAMGDVSFDIADPSIHSMSTLVSYIKYLEQRIHELESKYVDTSN